MRAACSQKSGPSGPAPLPAAALSCSAGLILACSLFPGIPGQLRIFVDDHGTTTVTSTVTTQMGNCTPMVQSRGGGTKSCQLTAVASPKGDSSKCSAL